MNLDLKPRYMYLTERDLITTNTVSILFSLYGKRYDVHVPPPYYISTNSSPLKLNLIQIYG